MAAVTLALLLFLLPTRGELGTPPNRVILVAERSQPTGIEQTALVLDSDGARLTLNANFLDLRFLPEPPAKPVRIGVFKTALSAQLQSQHAFWKNVYARLTRPVEGAPKRRATPNLGGPHGAKVLLNGFELSSSSHEFEEAMDLLGRAYRLAKWGRSPGWKPCLSRSVAQEATNGSPAPRGSWAPRTWAGRAQGTPSPGVHRLPHQLQALLAVGEFYSFSPVPQIKSAFF